MPPSWRAGSWLLYFLIQVNYLIAFAFNLALGNPASRDNDLIRITCQSGEMIFRRLEEHLYTLTMTLLGNEFTYRLTMVLRTTPLEPQERPTDDQVGIPRIDAFASFIPALPVHTLMTSGLYHLVSLSMSLVLIVNAPSKSENSATAQEILRFYVKDLKQSSQNTTEILSFSSRTLDRFLLELPTLLPLLHLYPPTTPI